VLRGYDDPLAERCRQIAIQVWGEEHTHAPVIFRSFNTTGGEADEEEVSAMVELLIGIRGGSEYKARLRELLPLIQTKFAVLGCSRYGPFPTWTGISRRR
jgi:endoglucanase